MSAPATTTARTPPRPKPSPTLTADEWRQFAEQLGRVHATGVYLLADADVLRLGLVQVAATRLAIGVYVNGWFRGRWLLRECTDAEARWLPVRRRKAHPGLRAKWERKHGRRGARAMAKLFDPDRVIEYRDALFRTAAEARRHLERTARSLHWLQVAEASERLAALTEA